MCNICNFLNGCNHPLLLVDVNLHNKLKMMEAALSEIYAGTLDGETHSEFYERAILVSQSALNSSFIP